MATDGNARPPEVALAVEDSVITCMERRLQTISATRRQPGDACTIHRVLPSIRGDDDLAFDPSVISIGPLHRKDENLSSSDDLKWRFLHGLLHRHPTNSIRNYVNAVRPHEPRARKQYADKLDDLDGDAFVQMLVLDGCFIVELLIKLTLDDKDGDLYDVNWMLPLIRRDLLLLENQIPFFVLQLLFDATVVPDFFDVAPPITLTELAMSYVTHGRMEKLPHTNNDEKSAYHLLHLFQLSLTPSDSEVDLLAYSKLWMRALRWMKRFFSDAIFWFFSLLLYLFSFLLRRQRPRLPVSSKDGSRVPRTIPNATELQEAGIVLKQKQSADCFLDVAFAHGVMEIPKLAIQAATISEFRNLVAFEQCCPRAGSHFTCYAAFMDNLIDTPEDVASLRYWGIIESKLGSDDDVAVFFNQLCKGGYLDYEKHYLVGLFKDVNDFCRTERHRWRAMLVHDYFSNPWAIVSFAAAFFLLVLTVVQTVFSILSYVKPPS